MLLSSLAADGCAEILADTAVQLLLDFTRPVGLLLVAVLHFLPGDEQARGILAHPSGRARPGSCLVISHACRDADPVLALQHEKIYTSRVDTAFRTRTREQVRRLFDGFSLVPPGLLWVPEWRLQPPDGVPGNPERLWMLGGVGRLSAPAG